VSHLPPRAKLGVLVIAVALVLGGAVYVLFLRGGEKPNVAAGSRFGGEDERGGGGTLLDALAPVLGARQGSRRTGSDPAPPTAEELGRAPADAVASLFLVGFRGTDPNTSFFGRLGARPFGGVILSRANYDGPQSITALTGQIQDVARAAGHPAPIVAAQQEGGDFSAFPNLEPRAQADVGLGRRAAIAQTALNAARQLAALGVGVNLAPNADIAVAGGPGQGRAFADQAAKVTTAVKASVAAHRRAGVAAAVGPFPGDGAASQDPSAGPAPVGLSLEDLRDADMKPFAAVATGSGAAAAMQMSNAIYIAYDSVTPATLLPEAIKELRDRLGFKGAIISADLVATTATTGGSVGEAAVDALKAGADMLLVPGGRAQQDEAYRAVVAAVRNRSISPERVVEALQRIAGLRRATRETRDPIRPQT